MGANNSKHTEKSRNLEESQRNHVQPNLKFIYQQSGSIASQKSLIVKIKNNLYRNRSAHSSSERIHSDSSISNSLRKKKKFFNRKSRDSNRTIYDDDEFVTTSSSSAVSSRTDHTLEKSSTIDSCDPMIIAAEKASARFDLEKGAMLLQPSSPPCAATQHAASRLARCHYQNKDNGMNSHTNSIQPNSSCTETLRKYSPRARRDSICRKLNKEWFSSNNDKLSTNQKNKCMSSQDVMLDLYLRPSSEVDRRKEKDRQQRLHYLLKRVWNGMYRAKLNKPAIIVNWCCGIGMWDMEMALLFPNAQVIGVDFKEATLSNLQHNLPNLQFRHAVIHDAFTGLESFESNSVDFIMMRDVWLINTPVTKWNNVFKESLRILKPGGWIEVAEHTLSIQSGGPCVKQLCDWFEEFFSEIQVDRAIAEKLGSYLTRTGFEDVDQDTIVIPLGEWASTTALKETGYLFKDLVERRIRGLSKWVCDINRVEEPDMNRLISTSMDEEVDQYHSFMSWISYTAQKSINSNTPASVDKYPTKPHYLNVPASHSAPSLPDLPPPPPPSTETSSINTARYD